MGEAIINAIKSGLGLITDLAGEFLSGFTALFWDATANSGSGALTTFGIFALVMLGRQEVMPNSNRVKSVKPTELIYGNTEINYSIA